MKQNCFNFKKNCPPFKQKLKLDRWNCVGFKFKVKPAWLTISKESILSWQPMLVMFPCKLVKP